MCGLLQPCGKRFLGHSLTDVLHGLRKEDISAQNIAFMERSLFQPYLVQYLEKKEPKFSETIRSDSDSEYRTRWRDIMANTYGCTLALLLANKSETLGLISTAIQMTFTSDTLCLDFVSQSLVPATMNSQGYRRCLQPKIRKVYLEYLNLLDMIPTAPLLSRSVSPGLHFIPGMDGARERWKKVRFPMSASLDNRVRSYMKQ